MDNMSLSDIAAVTNAEGFGGNSAWLLILIFLLVFGGFRGQGDFGQYATASSQQEILFGQQFQNLDNKMDRLGNGISDATFALNNTIVNGNNNVAGTVIAEGRSLADKMCDLRSEIHAEGEATRALIQQNKIETLQAEINDLKTAAQFANVPRINPYGYGIVSTCGCNCNCGNI